MELGIENLSNQPQFTKLDLELQKANFDQQLKLAAMQQETEMIKANLLTCFMQHQTKTGITGPTFAYNSTVAHYLIQGGPSTLEDLLKSLDTYRDHEIQFNGGEGQSTIGRRRCHDIQDNGNDNDNQGAESGETLLEKVDVDHVIPEIPSSSSSSTLTHQSEMTHDNNYGKQLRQLTKPVEKPLNIEKENEETKLETASPDADELKSLMVTSSNLNCPDDENYAKTESDRKEKTEKLRNVHGHPTHSLESSPSSSLISSTGEHGLNRLQNLSESYKIAGIHFAEWIRHSIKSGQCNFDEFSHHPFLFSPAKLLNFIHDLKSFSESKDDFWLPMDEAFREHHLAVFKKPFNWKTQVPELLFKTVKKKYYGDEVGSLIELISDKMRHATCVMALLKTKGQSQDQGQTGNPDQRGDLFLDENGIFDKQLYAGYFRLKFLHIFVAIFCVLLNQRELPLRKYLEKDYFAFYKRQSYDWGSDGMRDLCRRFDDKMKRMLAGAAIKTASIGASDTTKRKEIPWQSKSVQRKRTTKNSQGVVENWRSREN